VSIDTYFPFPFPFVSRMATSVVIRRMLVVFIYSQQFWRGASGIGLAVYLVEASGWCPAGGQARVGSSDLQKLCGY
jgi:hypothetical protein